MIEHTETLAADGSWFANIVGINKEQTDVYIAAGGAPPKSRSGSPSSPITASATRGSAGLSAPLRPDDIVAVVIASDTRADRFVHGIRRASGPPAPERRVEPARQLPLGADRLPAARARRVDRRHPGVRRGRDQQRADRAVPLALARQPARRSAARWPHPDLLAALAVRRRSRRGRAGRRLDRRRRGLERRDRDRAVDALRALRGPPRARGQLRRDGAVDRVSAGHGRRRTAGRLSPMSACPTTADVRRRCSTTRACTSATG